LLIAAAAATASLGQTDFSIPLRVSVGLVGFDGDGGGSVRLPSESLQRALSEALPVHVPAVVEAEAAGRVQFHLEYRAAHLERVQRYSRILTQHLRRSSRLGEQINEEFVRLIYLTSPLHDIGKVGIPDCVLLKPGRLSDNEFEMMKTHTTLGGQTLEAALRKFPNVKFLQMARDIAMTHHEHYDGKGYPAGLVGDGIPLCGRVVALADVYDALTSKRVYKDAFCHEVAKAIIVGDSGAHFDPDVVSAFLSAEQEFRVIRDQFSEAPVLQ